jgi:solute carrier family 35, member F5
MGGCTTSLTSLTTLEEAAVKSSRYALGLFFIFLHVCTWICGAVLTQAIYEVDEGVPAFLLTYLGMSLSALALPIHFLKEWWYECGVFSNDPAYNDDTDNESVAARPTTIENVPSVDTLDAQLACAKHCSDYVDIATASERQLANDHRRIWNHRRHFTAALFLTPAMFGADLLFNMALASTTVATTTVLISTQSLFVFLFAVLLALEHFSLWKLAGVIAGLAGTTMIVMDELEEIDSSQDHLAAAAQNAMIGDFCALVAAIFYATYTIQVRKYCPENEELYSMMLLLGYNGSICAVLLAPVAIYKAAQVQWTLQLFLVCCVKGLLDFAITDYFMFRSVVLTNATVATVGLGLTIPMGFCADWLLGKLGGVTALGIWGAAGVASGFLMVNLVPDQVASCEDPERYDDPKQEGLAI